MKLSIAICEDDMKINAELEYTLEAILKKLNIKYEIDVYFSGEKLCKKLEAGQNYNLIFLDIEYGEGKINGVEIGNIIRVIHQNNSISIVYISWESHYSINLHNTQPLNFLIKPLKYEKIEEVVYKYLTLARLWSSYFTYKLGYETYRKQVKDIAYVESRDRKLIIHLANGKQKEFYGSLKKVYIEQLQKFDFLFIHAAYAVNYDFISQYKYTTICMNPGDVILPISQNRRTEVRKRFLLIESKRGG
ncbi:MAG: LytTR family DNA-binding domain-containing protein [Defluviitaleaceae bacterium]|nr:LytTR family DNA-binding domain-containing protein [Defluviitaleaceae bacterium]